MPVISNLEPPPEHRVKYSFYVAPTQLAAWKQAAGKQPLSAWLRDAADAAVKQQNER